MRYLSLKAHLRDVEKQRQLCRKLDAYLGRSMLNDITGDAIWGAEEGNKAATINRCLALVRSILRMAHREWQWLDAIPMVRLLPGEVERDRWLTKEEADRLISFCPPHLAALVRFALATGCWAREIAGLEWDRVDLSRGTARLDHTKNGTPRGVPANRDAVAVLEGERGKHEQFLHVPRPADSLRADEYGVAERGAQERADRPALSRPAPHLGLLASAGGNVDR